MKDHQEKLVQLGNKTFFSPSVAVDGGILRKFAILPIKYLELIL